MILNAETKLRETTSCAALTVDALPQIPEEKVLCMTVNGVLQDVKPGAYSGAITLYVLDAMTEDIAADPTARVCPACPKCPVCRP